MEGKKEKAKNHILNPNPADIFEKKKRGKDRNTSVQSTAEVKTYKTYLLFIYDLLKI